MTPLDGWQNFYVIVGSSAGALIGLQFVVLTLIAQREPVRISAAGTTFSTPTVVHFAVALLLSAVASAPWHTVTPLTIPCGLVGLSGIVYSTNVARRMQKQTVYQPVLEDWVFHVLLPLGAYGMLAASTIVARSTERQALYMIGAATLIFLFVGIHNAWDAVTYHIFSSRDDQQTSESPDQNCLSKDSRQC